MSSRFERRSRGYPVITEIAGPAGSGKSTLVETLTARPGLATPKRPSRSDSVEAMVKALVGRWSGLGKVSGNRSVIRSLAHLDHWARLSKTVRSEETHFVIDQGPVYRIIHVTHSLGLPRSQSSWWSDQLRAWSEVLDAVVYLDAPDEVLFRRMAGRTKHHRLEDVGEEAARVELARVRGLFAAALSTLEDRGVAVLRVDTRSLDPTTLDRAVAPELGIGR